MIVMYRNQVNQKRWAEHTTGPVGDFELKVQQQSHQGHPPSRRDERRLANIFCHADRSGGGGL